MSAVADDPAIAARRRRGGLLRVVAALGLLLLEYLFVSTRFDAHVLYERGGHLAFLGYLGDGGAILLLIAAATLALAGPRLRIALESVASRQSAIPRLAGVVHAAAYIAFLLTCARVLDPDAADIGNLDVALWLSAAALVPITWIPLALPWDAVRALWPQVATAFALGAFVGVLSWFSGQLTMSAWYVLAPTTVSLVVDLLHWMAPVVVSDLHEAIVGTPDFQVVVAPVCSGLEGIGLIVTLVGSYIAVERKHLRVGRALLVLPLAVAASFFANALRIALLVMVGTRFSPDIALGGFHSKAGWLFFCALSFVFIGVLRGVRFFRASDAPESEHEPLLRTAAAPYLVPMLAVIAISLLTGLFSDGFDRWYGLRVVVGASVLWAYRRHYERPQLGGLLAPLGVGAAVCGVWLVLAEGGDAGLLHDGLDRISRGEALAWLVLRALGSVLVVPIVEELAFRGYVMRQLMASDFRDADVRVPHARAWIISSLAFGLLHADWIAGVIAGLLLAWVQQRRGRLSDAVVAHGTANALLLLDAWLRGNLHWLA